VVLPSQCRRPTRRRRDVDDFDHDEDLEELIDFL
jgi:hypothetical protein